MSQRVQKQTMIKNLILFVMIIGVAEGSYSCAQPNGTFQNQDDYRSYYTCINGCDRLDYCIKPTEYYSSIGKTCKETGLLWSPGYDLTGVQQILPLVQYRHFLQTNFDVYWSSETQNHQFAFTGRYINETNVVGTETILSLKNKCVLVRDVQLLVRDTRSLCITNVENPYSMKCALPLGYDFSTCITY